MWDSTANIRIISNGQMRAKWAIIMWWIAAQCAPGDCTKMLSWWACVNVCMCVCVYVCLNDDDCYRQQILTWLTVLNRRWVGKSYWYQFGNCYITEQWPFSFSLRIWERVFFKSIFNDIFRVLSIDNSSCKNVAKKINKKIKLVWIRL